VEFSNNATNVQRSLNVLRNLTEEFTQPVYGGVVQSTFATIDLQYLLVKADLLLCPLHQPSRS
jgi:hypothetical protein